MTAAPFLSGLAPLAHAGGYLGFVLIALTLVYSLRKRKWGIKAGSLRAWLWSHHLLGFFGGILALAHTMGSLRGLGLVLAVLLVVVLVSSAPSLLEARSTAPLRRRTADLARRRRERDRLDASYREMHAKGTAWTYEGHDAYDRLTAENAAIEAEEAELKRLSDAQPNWAWWRWIHYPATAMLFGVLVVHIWAKLFLRSGVL